MTRKILGGFAVVIVLLIVIVATRPAEFSVRRQAHISAPAAVVYAQVADFHRWESWSPWAKIDPNMKTTYTGVVPGELGSSYAWLGNDQVGQGRMTIVGSHPSTRLDIKLEFIKPFQATNDTSFILEPQGDGTSVTWVMSGHNDFVGKAFTLFASMDKMVGGDFERGLAQLDKVSVAEATKVVASPTPAVAPALEPSPAAPAAAAPTK